MARSLPLALSAQAPFIGVFVGMGLLWAVAPDYIDQRGFPLDDAWIHAVYARSLVTEGWLAYNPGEPAAGETSPLWAFLLAPIQAGTGGVPAYYAAMVKVLGLCLHGMTAAVVASAMRAEALVREPDPVLPGLTTPVRPWEEQAVAGAVGFVIGAHPDLIAAAVSGMEVPLATLLAAALLHPRVRRRPDALFALSALAWLGRSELAVPIVLMAGLDLYKKRYDEAIGALSGLVLGIVLFAGWCQFATGRPLPSTFYAKAGQDWFHPKVMLYRGSALIGSIAGLGFGRGAVAVIISVVAAIVAWKGWDRWGPAWWAVGVAFVGASLVIVPPVDPTSFYQQRYILPALIFGVAGAVSVGRAAVGGLLASGSTPPAEGASAGFRWDHGAGWALGLLLGGLGILQSPDRYVRLDNDAKNIDDLQVSLGKALADAAPTDVVWLVDAGASRYFGRAYVVDLVGLNSPKILEADPAPWLATHPPAAVDQFALFTEVGGEISDLPRRRFTATGLWTVSRFDEMRTHTLVGCLPGHQGTVTVKQKRTHAFVCPEAGPAPWFSPAP